MKSQNLENERERRKSLNENVLNLKLVGRWYTLLVLLVYEWIGLSYMGKKTSFLIYILNAIVLVKIVFFL